jgi:hypothetical protein
MNYSAGDLVDDLEFTADLYGVPMLPPTDLATFHLDPTDEDDATGILLERVAHALADRQHLGAALVNLLAHIDDLARDFTICGGISVSSVGIAARVAITQATRGVHPSVVTPKP